MTIIRAFDTERTTNAQLLADAHRLGYLPEPILDLTYGEGKFWTDLPALDVLRNDLDPAKGNCHYDFTDTPWHDDSWPTVVFDPPYRLGGTPSTPDFDNRYGIDVLRSAAEVRDLIEDGTREAIRLSNRFVLVKVQDMVSSGRLQRQTTWVENAAAGSARVVDELHKIGGRAQPTGTRQVRARHGYSTLLVLEVTR